MRNILVLAALESEFFSIKGPIKNIYYTGIGKINAARVATELILTKKPDLVLNVGTAGCLHKNLLGEVFGIRDVIERDMDAEPLAPRGMVPLSNQTPLLNSQFGTVRCATGDSFVTSKDQWLLDNRVDLVDMELFAIAKVANHYAVEWKSIKFASDLADKDSGELWTASLGQANSKINQMIDLALA